MSNSIQRVSTGIAGLDEMLHGGFMPLDAVMVAGSAGTGKTTLSLQYLYNGATKYNEPGIYLTFEQLPDQIYRDSGNFGMDLRTLEKENKLRIVMTSPDILIQEGGEQILEDVIKEVGARRIVVDSLSHLEMYVGQDEIRKQAYRLVMYMKTRGLSGVYLWEAPQLMGQTTSITEVGLSFVLDSIIFLRQVEIESAIRRAMVILKMRGSDHDNHLREYQITSRGIRVESAFAEYQGLMSGNPTRVASEKFRQLFSDAAKGKKR